MYSEEEEEVFLGRSVTQHKNVSDDTAHAIDEEIRSFIDRNYDRSRNLLVENMDKLHLMAEALVKYETIDEKQIEDIMAGRTPRPPANWEDTSPPTGGVKTTGEPSGSEKPSDGGTIGGPAKQH
jgi:cell division protease FtsH